VDNYKKSWFFLNKNRIKGNKSIWQNQNCFNLEISNFMEDLKFLQNINIINLLDIII